MTNAPPSPERVLATRVLAVEDDVRAGPADPVSVGERALARLRGQLLLWFGPDGVHALFARAINRAAVVHPMLADVRASPQDGRHLDRLAGPATPEGEDVREALIVLLATLFALLARLVGSDLVELVTTQIWSGGDQDGRQIETRSTIRE